MIISSFFVGLIWLCILFASLWGAVILICSIIGAISDLQQLYDDHKGDE